MDKKPVAGVTEGEAELNQEAVGKKQIQSDELRKDADKSAVQQTKPKSGDGTQDVPAKGANQFGASQEPQEEFIDDSSSEEK